MEEYIRFAKCGNIQADYLAMPSSEIGFFIDEREDLTLRCGGSKPPPYGNLIGFRHR